MSNNKVDGLSQLLLQYLQLAQGKNQTSGTTKSSSTSSANFWEDESDSYLDWQEGDNVYWSDSSSDDAFWAYIDQKAEAAKASTGGGSSDQLTMLAKLLGISPEQLTTLFGDSKNSLNIKG